MSEILGEISGLLNGAVVTVFVTCAAMAVALVVGLVLALARIDKRRWYLNLPAQLYIEVFRGTPLLLQIYYIFFVLPVVGIRLDAIPAAVIGLGFNYAAYLSEVYRAGLEAVGKGQREAAQALGMSFPVMMRLVVLPQAIRIIIPPLGNHFIGLFKDTALVSTIGVVDLLFAAKLSASISFQYFNVFTAAMIVYLAICYPAGVGVRRLEKALRIP